mmetsp:Transcript_24304/g.62088  ORF Transcript_24304/g.62088 Transcript_24304/m.62088 type:complete len:200 (-) Transcript_24304:262-861(-)
MRDARRDDGEDMRARSVRGERIDGEHLHPRAVLWNRDIVDPNLCRAQLPAFGLHNGLHCRHHALVLRLRRVGLLPRSPLVAEEDDTVGCLAQDAQPVGEFKQMPVPQRLMLHQLSERHEVACRYGDAGKLQLRAETECLLHQPILRCLEGLRSLILLALTLVEAVSAPKAQDEQRDAADAAEDRKEDDEPGVIGDHQRI